ncbi:MAG: phosphomannomutase/phosphoglucomutase, partial [Luteimonas sp.]
MTAESTRFKLNPAPLGPALPWLAGVLALLAAWMLWSGLQQMREATRQQALIAQRDASIAAVNRYVGSQTSRLRGKLAEPAVQSALQSGDLPSAAAHLRADWPGVEVVDVLPADLQAAYAGLPASGYG